MAGKIMTSPAFLTWTDFEIQGRVVIVSRHGTLAAGERQLRKHRKGYPNLKLIATPDGLSQPAIDAGLDGDVWGDDAKLISTARVLFS